MIFKKFTSYLCVIVCVEKKLDWTLQVGFPWGRGSERKPNSWYKKGQFLVKHLDFYLRRTPKIKTHLSVNHLAKIFWVVFFCILPIFFGQSPFIYIVLNYTGLFEH